MLPKISKKNMSIIMSATPDFKRLRSAGSTDAEWQKSLELFLQLLYSQGFVQRFDWQSEFSGKEQYLRDDAALSSMTLEEVRKVLIAHVRLDRLSEGHLNSIALSGYLEQLIKRLEVLQR